MALTYAEAPEVASDAGSVCNALFTLNKIDRYIYRRIRKCILSPWYYYAYLNSIFFLNKFCYINKVLQIWSKIKKKAHAVGIYASNKKEKFMQT